MGSSRFNFKDHAHLLHAGQAREEALNERVRHQKMEPGGEEYLCKVRVRFRFPAGNSQQGVICPGVTVFQVQVVTAPVPTLLDRLQRNMP